MPEQIQKLSPDRDLQCYFFQPSAVAALSGASSSGFTLSGTWRQQFDWAVTEWNRDNVYEHPAFRNLPDGDLSGLALSYEETRENCIPLDSTLYATVDWPSVRVWATPGGGVETIYFVPLVPHAEAIEGSYQCAYADFTLSGTVADGDYVGLATLTEHHTYPLSAGNSLADAAQAITDSINGSSVMMKATRIGATVRLFYTGGTSIAASTAGANGNRFAAYSYSTGAATWDVAAKTFDQGTSPTKWRVTLDFSSLEGTITPDLSGTLYTIPTNNVRKVRWTYSADLQTAAFERSEFRVVVTNWAVTGINRTYSVAGTGSRRIESHDASLVYSGAWTEVRGNYSGGTIHKTTTPGDSVTASYQAARDHILYVGLRYTDTGGAVAIVVDGLEAGTVNMGIPAEDALFRFLAGNFSAGSHTVVVTHTGAATTEVYFDFLELASPATDLPVVQDQSVVTLATDWDTLHCISIAPERTAWMLRSLGFLGRANHYVGALWFYELIRIGHSYASGTVTFSGTPAPNAFVTVTLGPSNTVLTKLIHVGDTADTVATVFAQELNRGYTGVWADASGGILTIHARMMGGDGNSNTLEASTTSGGFTATASGTAFEGGVNGDWRTDLTANPALNRAVRDWSVAYFVALAGYGIDAAAAFSTELQHGDPTADAGIAQVGPLGDPVVLPTPALQTNFSPTSLAFWQEIYAEMAGIQAAAGLTPYLQFGEVQWWYFPNDGLGFNYSGMPFYDAWNRAAFEAQYGHPMATITGNTVDPTAYPDEVEYLPTVIGNFTTAIMDFVRSTQPACRFEVLYPTDVNQTAFNRAINYPASAWTPETLTCLKTEAFGFTFGRNLDKSWETLAFGDAQGFTAAQRSHLVGAGDSTSAWLKEVRGATGKRFESVVLFAVDQFCLIGYEVPLPDGLRRSFRIGQ